MLFAQLTTEEKQQLRDEINKAQQVKWYRRLKIIDLSSQGYTVPELAEMFALSQASIRTYIHDYNADGLAGLQPNQSPGRPTILQWSKAEWENRLYQAPCDFENLKSGAKNWNQALLKQYLANYHQLQVSQGTISKALRAVGIHWRRAKLKVHSPDPMYQVKRERIEHLRQKALTGELSGADAERPPPDADKPAYLAYFDATDLHWCPDIGNTYIASGHQLKVDSPGADNPWYALLGSLLYPAGEGLYTIHQRKRSVESIAHLQLLIDIDPHTFWFVVIDNASAHHTETMQAFASAHWERLELVFLPTYAPHLNLIERLWRLMRAQVTRDHYYDSLDHLAQTIVSWLECLPFSSFCSLMGVDDGQLSFV